MKRLLVVVDYQNDFVDGSLGFPGAKTLLPGIRARIEDYRAAGDDIAFTFDTHGADYLSTQEGRLLPVAHGLRDSAGWQLYGGLSAYITEETPCFIKNTFGSMDLAHYLAAHPYDAVELCGLVSNMCVLSNAVLCKAALPEAEIIIDAALTNSFDAALHEKTLDVMAGLQMTVLRDTMERN